MKLVDILVATKLAFSKREARELIRNGAISVATKSGWVKLTNEKIYLTNNDNEYVFAAPLDNVAQT